MDITEVTIIHHVAIVLLMIWFLSSFNYCHPLAYFLSLIYLYVVHDRNAMRFRRKVQFEERRQTNQKRVLSDSESVRWLNHTIERIWPICMEELVSQKILLPIIPWFLQKYKPWTVKEAVVQSLYMGRSPPMFTEMRVCRQSTEDDHLVLELGVNFHTADDMSAILAVKMTKRLGFGMSAKMHLTGMHVEGKVLVGVKFLPRWPFLGRLRVCFVEPPYFQMTVKPLFSHGLDVTELPGIAGWLDKLLTVVFEETLVEPNMMVVDVEKFISPEPETWFSVDAKEPVAYALVEVMEASDMKPSDMNGLADPYVKGQLGAYRFRTKTQRKILSPKWLEEFKIPISTWDQPNVLNIQVCDKDHFVDDSLGDCSIKVNDLRDGQRHDMWLPLENIKMGRLHLAITVIEADGKVSEQAYDGDTPKNEWKKLPFPTDAAEEGANSGEVGEKSPRVEDNFEPIDVEGQRATGIWVHRPGTEVPQVWEPRKGKNRSQKDSGSVGGSIKSESYPNDSSSTDDSLEGRKTNSRNPFKRGIRKIGSVFHRSSRSPVTEIDKSRSFNRRDQDNGDSPLPSSHENVRAMNAKGIGVKLVMDDNLPSPSQTAKVEVRQSTEEPGPESPDKRKVKDTVKNVLKHAGNSARSVKHVLSRKGSRGRDRDVPVPSDSSGDGSTPSPVYRPENEATQVAPNSSRGYLRSNSSLKFKEILNPVDSHRVSTDPMGSSGRVKVEDNSGRVATNIADANGMDRGGLDESGRMVQEVTGNQ